ncbi:MAG: AraC family transcriptional regulator ligand-binding domain-containing protein [Candidatus Electrothrix aestuarii]|uniref:AraC family transcriptional regulator ligand-binding domain-containing protein n=1 Tax=Candidatus Electrothrix aestuarii TaxID=3062594 RepID=A0AAU8LXE4_9BACT|nr:AraC family transcriptional regulator ligand-binding domain-containing protein [Candidatus Electrothrix aestuarii]
MPSPREIPQEYRILSSMGTVTVFFAAYLGLSVEYISKETNIDPGRLIDPENYLPEEFFEKFFQMLIRKFPKRNVALELARVAPMSYFGTPGQLFLRAPDAQSMLDIFVNHCDLFADRLEIRAISGSQETFFRTRQPLSDVDQGMSAEIGLGIGARITRECFGEGLLTRVQFRHRARGPVATYREFFGVPVSFGAEFNALVFSSHELKKRSNKRGGQEMRSSLEQRLQRLRQELGLDRADGLADIRRVAMCNAMKGDYSVDGLARSMGMSTCTLRRRMPEGVTPANLLGEVRYVNAMGMLADKSLSIDEVSFRLGFESDRGFRKAFKRWSGKTPVEARKEIR